MRKMNVSMGIGLKWMVVGHQFSTYRYTCIIMFSRDRADEGRAIGGLKIQSAKTMGANQYFIPARRTSHANYTEKI